MSVRQLYRLRAPSSGREVLLAAEPGSVYRDHETGEQLEVVGQGAAAAAVEVQPAMGRRDPAVLQLVRPAGPEGPQRLPDVRPPDGRAAPLTRRALCALARLARSWPPVCSRSPSPVAAAATGRRPGGPGRRRSSWPSRRRRAQAPAADRDGDRDSSSSRSDSRTPTAARRRTAAPSTDSTDAGDTGTAAAPATPAAAARRRRQRPAPPTSDRHAARGLERAAVRGLLRRRTPAPADSSSLPAKPHGASSAPCCPPIHLVIQGRLSRTRIPPHAGTEAPRLNRSIASRAPRAAHVRPKSSQTALTGALREALAVDQVHLFEVAQDRGGGEAIVKRPWHRLRDCVLRRRAVRDRARGRDAASRSPSPTRTAAPDPRRAASSASASPRRCSSRSLRTATSAASRS